MMMTQTEVLIVGGGPAGAACAMTLKQKGVDCIILDKEPFPRFKPCAGWITPDLFRLLGMNPNDYPGGLTAFRSFVVSVSGFRFTLPVRQYAIRRYEFDDWLLRKSGAPFDVHDVKVIERTADGYRIDGAYSAKCLVGAGGAQCPVYRTLFRPISPMPEGALIVAQEEEFLYPVRDERCRLWFFDRGLPGYAWYVPKTGGYLNIGIGGKAAALKARGKNLHSHWVQLVRKLDDLGLVRGHVFRPGGHYYYLRQRRAKVRLDNAFLVGDAAALATLDMGEGIRPAIQSGIRAAEAIINGGDYSLASIPAYSWPSLIGL
jgi:flavin-dependent dehydrogenase